MEPILTPRQRRFVDLAGDLAARFAARAEVHDRDGSFPIENYADMHEAGYLKLIVPREYGGEGADLFEIVLAQERLARGDGSTAMAVDMTMHLIGQQIEARRWPEPIFAEICRSIAAQGALINSAASEPEMGSPSRGGLPTATATPAPGGWLINGHKIFVSMAPALHYIITTVALPPGPDAPDGARGSAIVRAGAPGLRLKDTWSDALSLRTSGNYDVLLEDVFVPDEWVVDRAPAGAPMTPPGPPLHMAWSALSLAAVYLGIGEAARDTICRYARERTPSALGRPIATLPAIQRRIGEIQTGLMSARAVLYAAAQEWVARPDRREAMPAQIAMAKYLCTNAAIAASDHALRIAGGFGLTRQLPLERYYRDARAGLTHPPQDDVSLELIGQTALKSA